MKKPNIRSIRFSDETAELIDRQQGDNFTQKFENLITRCIWELPAREQKLAELERLIEERRKQLQQMSQQAGELGETLNSLLPKVRALDLAVKEALEKWDM